MRIGLINNDFVFWKVPTFDEYLKVVIKTETKINFNDYIKVKLTDHGKDIYYHRYDDINRAYGKIICKPDYPKADKDGYTRFQLWQFIELYGSYIGMIRENVIDPLEIVWMGE